MNDTITWECDFCQEEILEDGWISVYSKDIREYQARKKAWDKRISAKYAPDYTRPSVMPLTEYDDLPNLAHWHVGHLKCYPQPEPTSQYDIETSRAKTAWALLDWTSHLMEKNWLKNTDWQFFIRGVLNKNHQGNH